MESNNNQTARTAEAIKKAESAVKALISSVANTQDGIAFLKWLEAQCGYNSTSIVFLADGSINTDAVIANEAIRRMYLNIRKRMEPEVLEAVNHFDLKKYLSNEVEED